VVAGTVAQLTEVAQAAAVDLPAGIVDGVKQRSRCRVTCASGTSIGTAGYRGRRRQNCRALLSPHAHTCPLVSIAIAPLYDTGSGSAAIRTPVGNRTLTAAAAYGVRLPSPSSWLGHDQGQRDHAA
jgi:hypothetical protein